MNKTNNTKILLTSVGRRTYMVKWFKEALDGHGEVHVVNSNALTPAFSVADKATVTPIIYSNDYIPFLLNYCKENSINIIIPLFDIDIPVLAASKNDFEKIGCLVLIPEEEIAKTCNDKYLSYKLLNNLEIYTPRSYIALNKAINDINKTLLKFPLIVKPRWGMGSIGILEIDNIEDLKFGYNFVKNKIKNSYLKYESLANIDNSVLIQEKISGEEYGLDIINDLQGDYINVVVKKKISMRAGETDIAQIMNTNSSFLNLAQLISSHTRHPGNLDMDVIKSSEKLYVLEMNPRFGGGYPFSHMAGVNLPKAIIAWYNNMSIDKNTLTIKNHSTYMKDISLKKLN